MVLARPHHQQPFTSLYRPWVLGKLNGFNRVQLCRAIQSDVGGDNMCLINESYKGHVEVVRAMLKSKGEDVNIMDEVGNTALIVASENGHLEVVCELLNHHGVDVKIKNNGGNTALIVASWMGHLEVVCALLNHD
ncbi:hypothetical protein MHU86_19958 [Fragilaria crotonensis]|nr:hypothetical protein MHU86_19958 [Fragilaria crotonensis]